ncbi:Bifunctional purine biosynthetic protein ADE5,7 [Xanthoria parietina]
MPSKLVILISGNGSNLQAIIDAVAAGVLADTIIALVVSNRKDAYGLERARKANIPTLYHNLVPYGKAHPSADPSTKYSPAARAAYDADLAEKVLAVNPDLVVCAGW